MNIIEKLEALIKLHSWDHEHANGDIENLVSVYDLRAIIEEYKNAQEPFGYFKAEPFGWTDCAETDEGAIALYENPPLSDETVKDAERYRWLVENRFLNGVDLKADGTSHFMARGLIGRARSLKDAIDEAMKADNAETKGA